MTENGLKGNIQVACKKCGKRVSLEQMKIEKKGGDLLCQNCYKQSPKDLLKSVDESKLEKTGPREGIRYRCITCGYKFKLKDKPNPNREMRCPYCNNDNVKQEASMLADEFLK